MRIICRATQSASVSLLLAILPLSQLSATEPMFRQPVALTASSDYGHIYTANRARGTISIVNMSTHTVTDEIAVGGSSRIS